MRIGVIGGGAWGTALAQVARAGGSRQRCSGRARPEVVESVNLRHREPLYSSRRRLLSPTYPRHA